ncbi:hypothetical protein DV735_g2430, partial [Chaetothyriales sp. CBS 134920]
MSHVAEYGNAHYAICFLRMDLSRKATMGNRGFWSQRPVWTHGPGYVTGMPHSMHAKSAFMSLAAEIDESVYGYFNSFG